ncbi:methyltransferase domain-containing protein [Thiohalorhabdus sp.]|uniref:methyltransferase domain-containing protein n=1 Tax=Thiohalorhabdus sp. TaxID=3094134 RepID=UPI002FC3DACA
MTGKRTNGDKTLGNVDETISAVPGEWRFNEEVSQAFDSHVRKSVPFYDEIQRMVVELSEYFVGDGSMVYDLGSSTGETLYRLADYHSGKENLQLTGVEVSEAMIEEARRKVQAPSVGFRHNNILDVELSPAPDLVTSVFTLQFLRLAERRRLLRRLAESLVEGGALILLEKTRGDSPAFEDMWTELYWDFKRRQGLSPEEVLEKASSLRGVLNPLTMEENMALLQQSGFSRVEPFFKWYNWAGFLAVKNHSLAAPAGGVAGPEPERPGHPPAEGDRG